jgi:hypothetical protein
VQLLVDSNILDGRKEGSEVPNFVLVYKGGGDMATDEATRQQTMEAWGKWFGSLGDRVVDGGNPFGGSASVSSSGAVSNGAASGLTGYSIIKADDMQNATQSAKTCPILSAGGSIEVYETFPVM